MKHYKMKVLRSSLSEDGTATQPFLQPAVPPAPVHTVGESFHFHF